MNVQPNWWENFFDGVVVSMWLQAVPGGETAREAERLVRLLDRPPGSEILDVPCGGGRLSLDLAGRGYRMTAVDLSSDFLDHARASADSQRVAWEQRDMRDLPWAGRFDGAFCVGNSFGYLDDAGNAAFLQAVRGALKKGGRLVLETPMVLENLLYHLRDRPWWKVGDMYLLVENRYEHTTERLEIAYTFVSDGGVEVRRGSHRAFSYRELIELVTAAGFDVELAEPWTREAHAVCLIATAL